jgi:CheY-like chemotaxis protein
MARILVIDDDAAVRAATKILLDANGFDTVVAESGKSGIAAASSASFDLAIVDLFMPGMNGLDTAKALREQHSSLPIIAVSGFMFAGKCPEMPNFDAIAAEAGAMSTLYKPFRPNDLLREIQKALASPA